MSKIIEALNCLSLVKVDSRYTLKLDIPLSIAEDIEKISVYKYLAGQWDLKQVINCRSVYNNPTYIEPVFNGLYKVVLKLSSVLTSRIIDTNKVEVRKEMEMPNSGNNWIKISDLNADLITQLQHTRVIQVWVHPEGTRGYADVVRPVFERQTPGARSPETGCMPRDPEIAANSQQVVMRLTFRYVDPPTDRLIAEDVTHFRFLSEDAPED